MWLGSRIWVTRWPAEVYTGGRGKDAGLIIDLPVLIGWLAPDLVKVICAAVACIET